MRICFIFMKKKEENLKEVECEIQYDLFLSRRFRKVRFEWSTRV
jgi:hypothetical protein